MEYILVRVEATCAALILFLIDVLLVDDNENDFVFLTTIDAKKNITSCNLFILIVGIALYR